MNRYFSEKIEELGTKGYCSVLEKMDQLPVCVIAKAYSSINGTEMTDDEISVLVKDYSSAKEKNRIILLDSKVQETIEILMFAIYMYKHEDNPSNYVSRCMPDRLIALNKLIPIESLSEDEINRILDDICHFYTKSSVLGKTTINILPQGLTELIDGCLGDSKQSTLWVYGPGAGDLATALDKYNDIRYFDPDPFSMAIATIIADKETTVRKYTYSPKALAEIFGEPTEDLASEADISILPENILEYGDGVTYPVSDAIVFIPKDLFSSSPQPLPNQLMLSSLHSNKLIMIARTSWLAKENGGWIHEFYKRGRVQAVVELPPNIWRQTKESTCLIIIDKTYREDCEDIIFVDATNSTERDNPHVLNVSNILDDIDRGAEDDYSDLLYTNVIRTSPDAIECNTIVPKWLTFPFLKDQAKVQFHTLGSILNSDIEDDKDYDCRVRITEENLRDSFPTDSIKIDNLEQDRRLFPIVETPAVFFTVKNNKVYSGYIKETGFVECPETIFAVLPKREADLQYIACLVQEASFYEQIEALHFPNFNKHPAMFSMLKAPDYKRNERLGYLYQRVGEALTFSEQKLAESFAKYKEDTHMRKHAIGQDLERLSGQWENLMKVRERDHGIISDDSTYGMNRTKISSIIESIGHLIDSVTIQIDIFTIEDDAKYSHIEEISLGDFITEYTQRNINTDFEFVPIINDKIVVKFSRSALNRILDNIVFNAWKHGFHNRKDYKNLIILYYFRDENNNVSMVISNNGAPLNEQIISTIFDYGTTTRRGVDGHCGTGCYEVKKLMTAKGLGDVSVISDPNMGLTVTFKLNFFFHN